MVNKAFYTTSEVAELLGISRIAVFKKIRAGQIKAQKIGRQYAIAAKEIPQVLERTLTRAQKREITAAVKKVVREYGDTLRLLGAE